MTVAVVLNNLSDGYSEEVIIENVENRTCFSYTDNDKNNCEMCVYDDGICFFKESDDHVLELHLRGNYYAKIIIVGESYENNKKNDSSIFINNTSTSNC